MLVTDRDVDGAGDRHTGQGGRAAQSSIIHVYVTSDTEWLPAHPVSLAWGALAGGPSSTSISRSSSRAAGPREEGNTLMGLRKEARGWRS